jgi:hypothetical protein
MSSYIYTMYAGADPGHGWVMNDPIFGKLPTLGACVPNIRRAVNIGDYLFTISGRITGEHQFVVGGFRVAEKIDALAAYGRFPEHRLRRIADRSVQGNIIVAGAGSQHPDDHHTNFARRVENYIVGCDPVVLESSTQFDRAREETLGVLSRIFGREGNRVFDIVGRQRRMNDEQAAELLSWLRSLKEGP